MTWLCYSPSLCMYCIRLVRKTHLALLETIELLLKCLKIIGVGGVAEALCLLLLIIYPMAMSKKKYYPGHFCYEIFTRKGCSI